MWFSYRWIRRLIISFSWSRWGVVQAPFCFEIFFNGFRCTELEVASLLWDGGALPLRLEAGDQFGDQSAGLLWVEVTSLLRNIDQSVQLG